MFSYLNGTSGTKNWLDPFAPTLMIEFFAQKQLNDSHFLIPVPVKAMQMIPVCARGPPTLMQCMTNR